MKLDDFFLFLINNTKPPSFTEYRAFFPKMIRTLYEETGGNGGINTNYFIVYENIFTEPGRKKIPMIVICSKPEYNASIRGLGKPFLCMGKCCCGYSVGSIVQLILSISSAYFNNAVITNKLKLIEKYLFQEGKLGFVENEDDIPDLSSDPSIDHKAGWWDNFGGNPQSAIIQNASGASLYELDFALTFPQSLPSAIYNTIWPSHSIKQIDFRERIEIDLNYPYYTFIQNSLWNKWFLARYRTEDGQNDCIGFVSHNDFKAKEEMLDEIITECSKTRTFGGVSVTIKDKGKLIEKIWNWCCKRIGQNELIIEYLKKWKESVLPLVEKKILPRFINDRVDLINRGFITNTDNLDSIEFSGSDFHKGSQQVLFLYFKDGDKITKIVYKPSNLSVDEAFFSSLLENSIVNILGNTAELRNYIQPYKILCRQDAGGEDYGYMEFVETAPITDARQLIKSLYANIFLSYIMGFKDIHHENYIIRANNIIQLIDMEVYSGIAGDNWFDDALWPGTITSEADNTVYTLLRQHRQGANIGAIKQNLPAFFTELNDLCKLIVATISNQNERFTNAVIQLNSKMARTVPIKTEYFYNLADKYYAAGITLDLQGWQNFIQNNYRSISVETFLFRSFLDNIATFEAIKRIDIPIYYYSLGQQMQNAAKFINESGNNIGPVSHAESIALSRDIYDGNVSESIHPRLTTLYNIINVEPVAFQMLSKADEAITRLLNKTYPQ